MTNGPGNYPPPPPPPLSQATVEVLALGVAMHEIAKALAPLKSEARVRVLRAAMTLVTIPEVA